MDDPIWISKELVMAIHKRQLAEHGGMDGVRDPGCSSRRSGGRATTSRIPTRRRASSNWPRLTRSASHGTIRSSTGTNGPQRSFVKRSSS
jgi:hypothetical protein